MINENPSHDIQPSAESFPAGRQIIIHVYHRENIWVQTYTQKTFCQIKLFKKNPTTSEAADLPVAKWPVFKDDVTDRPASQINWDIKSAQILPNTGGVSTLQMDNNPKHTAKTFP